MTDRLMYIPNEDTQNCPFWRLQLVVETFGHSTKWANQSKLIEVPKVVKPTNKKILLQNFGAEGNKQPIVPSLRDIVQ